LVHPGIYGELLTLFEGVDDLYALERLIGAAYGACCIDPSPDRLRSYAEWSAAYVFADNVPPVHHFVRHYARSIVEYAGHLGVLLSDFDMQKCLPPYGSEAPDFHISDEDIKSLADAAGDSAIRDSCIGH